MKYVLIVAGFAVACFSPAQARESCHHDVACQAKRDGTNVNDLRKRDQGMSRCLRAVGYTLDDWHARTVPSGPVDKVRACFSKNGLPTT